MRQAILTVHDEDGALLGLEGVLAVFRAAGIGDVDVLSCAGSRSVVRVHVESEIDESRLADLAAVDWFERVADPGPGYAYLVEFDVEDAATCDDGVIHCDAIDVTDGGVTVDVAGSQEAISDVVAEYEDAGADVGLATLRDYERRERPLDALTPRQREVVRVADEMGYFDVPRSASTKAIAAELDLDASTVAEHLQRAERNLIWAVLA